MLSRAYYGAIKKKNLPHYQPHAIKSNVDRQEEISQENDCSLLPLTQGAVVP